MGRSGVTDDTTKSSTNYDRDGSDDGNSISLTKGYIILQYAFGWTVDYIKGKWIKVCKQSGSPCIWGSCLERKTCKEFDLELYGLTRPQFVRFVRETSKELYEKEKRLYNAFCLMITGNLFIKDDKKPTIDVNKKKQDFLYDFPHDVEYPTETMIKGNLKYWEDYEGEITTAYWNSERADGCRGNLGMIARRCSVNDLLWQEYKQGLYTTQQALKCRIKIDHVRVACYPTRFQRKDICKVPAPFDHLESLNSEGKLEILIKQMDDCGYLFESIVPFDEKSLCLVREIQVKINKEKEEKQKKETDSIKQQVQLKNVCKR